MRGGKYLPSMERLAKYVLQKAVQYGRTSTSEKQEYNYRQQWNENPEEEDLEEEDLKSLEVENWGSSCQENDKRMVSAEAYSNTIAEKKKMPLCLNLILLQESCSLKRTL